MTCSTTHRQEAQASLGLSRILSKMFALTCWLTVRVWWTRNEH